MGLWIAAILMIPVDQMINKLYFSFLNYLEKKILSKKRRFVNKQNRLFLNKYGLNDNRINKKLDNCNYNGYQATPINLCKCLINSGILNKDDKIVDVGCGSGIFICYLISKGFLNVSGVEIDHNLYELAVNNIQKVICKEHLNLNINVLSNNFFELDDLDSYEVFYVFNSFNSEKTYCDFFQKVFESISSKKRKIKIIFLYLNAIAKKALVKQSWLTRTKVISDDRQFCNMCIKFTVYENEI